jgi:hypothetical protein
MLVCQIKIQSLWKNQKHRGEKIKKNYDKEFVLK